MLTFSLKRHNAALYCLAGLFILSSLKSYARPGPSEWRWAFFHPFAALKVKAKLPEALLVYKQVREERLLDTFPSGGRLDAFRHVYTMAFLSQYVAVRKLRKLGQAHEKSNYRDFREHRLEDGERADSLACVMDLLNNEAGFEIGISRHGNLKNEVLSAIKSGQAYYLKRSNTGAYVDCAGNPIDPEKYKGIWHVPKCLLKTNE